MDEKRLWFYLSEILEDPEVTKPPEVVVPGLAWADRVTLLAAREKGGKSTLAGAAAAALSAGSPFLGEATKQSTVLWISMEEHIGEISRRLVEFGAEPGNIAIANAFQEPLQDIPGIVEEVEPRLIVWDTLGGFADVLSSRPLEPNDSGQWTRVVRWITELSRSVEASSLLLHHARKSDGKYRDSTAIGANVDVILEMFGEGAQPRKIRGIGRWMIEELDIVLRDGVYRKHVAHNELATALVRFVAANPGCSWRQIREAVQGRAEDLARARDQLLESERLVNIGQEEAHKYVVGD
jgi:hypothetical protein